ncbi:carbamoyl phosphate synthase small subunit [Texcoconibacillus texcoconensis]|uniref:Carbamoyl phosphate synthase small chain n=1 Tax=Texcoconibacillus texcoconensis TaxID=1095777 RepID=A0A840QRS0_9BACI|nr:carbamoyl phosphate synthase small subunit [Texcoconibacillus texcoconensis]MBB5174172.1 carbamoyl-phosphate synthase small subunit [Texcoconibacillus texcoconensis]
MTEGYLQLETGETFTGTWIGSEAATSGEVVFNTSMTGYQEMMTDPSYAGQILTFCYPLIGNYGLNQADNESIKTSLSGVIISDVCDVPSHYSATKSVSDQLKEAGVPGLTGVDTRALVKTIRKHHTVKGVLVKSSSQVTDELWQQPSTEQLVQRVSTQKVQTFSADGAHIVLIDYGYKKSILDALMEKGCSVSIVPYDYRFEQIEAMNPDGVIFSNGPGDPMGLVDQLTNIRKVAETYPTLGICFGHQLIALAFGARTEKLPYGHRGANHPVKETKTGRVHMTSQNHGYVVASETIDEHAFDVSFYNINDGTVEGMTHKRLPVQSVQFHPEAHPGPSDTEYVFEAFIQQANAAGGSVYAKV